MASDNALGCLWVVGLAALLLLFAALAFGAPNIGADGLWWDNSAAIARTDARVEMNYQDNLTRRRESDNWHETTQIVGTTALQVAVICVGLWAAAKALPPIFASLATAFAAWAARPHRPAATNIHLRISYDQAQRLAQPHLLAMPGSRLEWIDGEYIDGAFVKGWAVVDDEREIVRPLLLEDRQSNG